MVNTYNQRNYDNHKLAKVHGTDKNRGIMGVSNSLLSRISWVYNRNGEKVIDKGWENTWGLKEVTLEPGFYIFVIYCARAGIYAYPHVGTTVEESKEYLVSCEYGGSDPDLKGKIRANFNEIPSTKG